MLFDFFLKILRETNSYLMYLLGLKVLMPKKSMEEAEILFGRVIIVLLLIGGIIIGVAALVDAMR